MAKVFFSYSHRDEDLRNELEIHLSILTRQGIITTWHDRRIVAGQETHEEISQHLDDADVVLLLVSANFLASDYCYEREMSRALARHREGECVVIPVILHPCEWQEAPFGSLQATPTDGKPISKFANPHDAFLEIARAIRAAVEAHVGSAVEPPTLPDAPLSPTTPEQRSSNLRIRKSFTDRDRDDFRDSAFSYILKFFDNSLTELAARNPGVEVRMRPEASRFSAQVYIGGDRKAACVIALDPRNPIGEITYSHGSAAFSGGINESMRVEDDGYSMGLQPLGLAMIGSRVEELLSVHGASEYFWSIFVAPLR